MWPVLTVLHARPPTRNMDINMLADLGAWGVVIAVLLWQQGVIKTLLEHQTQLIDKLVEKTRVANGSYNTADKSAMEVLPPTTTR